MPTDSVYLLTGLLVLIGIGAWAFGQFFDRDASLPTRISADYLRGLNLVLSRRTDEALELFIQMAKVDDDTRSATLTFPACAMHKVVASHGEPAGSANLCELFHEYFAGLMSAFTGKNYAAATLGTVGQCTVKFQIRS